MLGRIRRHHYLSILGAQVALLFISAVMGDHIYLRLLFVAAMLLVFGTVIITIWKESRLPIIIAVTSAVVAMACGVVGHMLLGTFAKMHFVHGPGEPADWLLAISCAAYLVFIVVAIVSIARDVFLHDKITMNVIVGSVCVYMLVGMFFGFLYAVLALANPHMFYMGNVLPESINISDFFYLSYSTLTTSGFGDLTATHPVARVIVSLEAVIGSLYIAVMVAGLVATYFAQRKNLPPHVEHPHL